MTKTALQFEASKRGTRLKTLRARSTTRDSFGAPQVAILNEQQTRRWQRQRRCALAKSFASSGEQHAPPIKSSMKRRGQRLSRRCRALPQKRASAAAQRARASNLFRCRFELGDGGARVRAGVCEHARARLNLPVAAKFERGVDVDIFASIATSRRTRASEQASEQTMAALNAQRGTTSDVGDGGGGGD